MKRFMLLLLAVPAIANAWQFEGAITSTNYGGLSDGLWYQQGMPHVLNVKTYGFAAGVTGTLYSRGSWGIDWHVDYAHLGHVSSDCDCTPIDQNYDTKTHSIVPNPIPVANAQFVGNGDAQGIALTLEPWVKYEGWRFGLEAGLFPYRPAWNETIYNWQVQPGVSQTLYANTPHAIQLGQVVGINVGTGDFVLGLKHYWLPTKFDGTHSPAIWKGATVVEVKFKY